ncbi:lymphatic vessel endothelial hyaluronic acid receptor 1a isoform X1 [Scomber scombrus]|uniref:lymphatic vessel endothelial hyaluronic acid receptor 1a isoform X1 n=1 Tax=Scomber scombrus TaxID=13677 RepID=UPI002DDBA92F|nr:lymphatic vessel endothelial hyaluronic acid receptor 1a isoform X1 [Scomber scombrus]
MNIMWLCIMSVLSITAVISDQNIDTSHIRVFPAVNRSIAGVFQVSYLNYLNQPQYAFNASDARKLCSTLGVNIASKEQVQKALRRGLETCRFGWIDEHLAVIPRIKALSTCGKNQTGLVTWRASVTQNFDVFCFNESDITAQLMDTTTQLPSESASSISPSSPPPVTSSFTTSLSFLYNKDSEAEPARFVGTAQGFAGAKAVLITSTCTFLLIVMVTLAYIKLKRSPGSSDIKQQEEHMETEEWTCLKKVKEPKKAAEEDMKMEVDDSASQTS